MHTKYFILTIDLTHLSIAFATPTPQNAPVTGPLPSLALSPSGPSKYGIFFGSSRLPSQADETSDPPDCLAIASQQACGGLLTRPTATERWIFVQGCSKSIIGVAGYWWPGDSLLPLPASVEECVAKIFAPMEKTLLANASALWVGSNVAHSADEDEDNGYPSPLSGQQGAAVDVLWPRFVLGELD